MDRGRQHRSRDPDPRRPDCGAPGFGKAWFRAPAAHRPTPRRPAGWLAGPGSSSTPRRCSLCGATSLARVSCEEAILQQAARIKAGGGLSVADAWIAATAVQRDAVLVHKDPEFARLRDVAQERLPS